jgi:hypothetical protein
VLTLIDRQFWTYAPAGVRAHTYSPSPLTSVGQLTQLRQEEESALRRAFPAANVDTSGNKAIKISGGSLARSVDVVPSHWFDTVEYQRTSQLPDRGVIILDKQANRGITNYPFKHIHLVGSRDSMALGGLRKAIRLCKNVKADADHDIALPSFDLAAIMYHANIGALAISAYGDLAVLAETQRHLDYLYHHQDEAKQLDVPDGTRRIFDSEAKLTALAQLSYEIDELQRAVATEHEGILRSLNAATARQILTEARAY